MRHSPPWITPGNMPKAAERRRIGVYYAERSDDVPPKALVRNWLLAALRVEGRRAGAIGVRFVDREEAARLNRNYRSRDYATNVLSFPYARKPLVDGDLVLCPRVVEAEAAEQGKQPLAHYAHLVIHGTLHLLGYDHVGRRREAARMEKRERKILARLGFADPYRSRR